MSTFDYFYGGEAEQYSFYRIPRTLIIGERFKGVSTDAKLLYCLAMLEHIKACRRELNTAERPEYPAQPELADFFKDPDMGADKERSKREIWHEARSLGMTPSEYAAQDYQPPGVSEESGHRKPPSQLPHRRISPRRSGPER